MIFFEVLPILDVGEVFQWIPVLLAGHRQAGKEKKKEREMKSSIANVSFPWAARLRKEAYRACDQPAPGREQSSNERKEKTANTEV